MYEELIEELRRPHADCNPWALMEQAADAIEELSKLADEIPHVCECCVGCELEKKNGGCDNAFVLSPKRAMQYLIKPRWIPVTEALPKDEKDVLAYYGFVHDGEMSEIRFIGAVAYLAFGTPPHWQHESAGLTVTHWMPLPQPPT